MSQKNLLEIRVHPRIKDVDEEIRQILRQMYHDNPYDKIVVQRQFTQGFSGSRVYLVQIRHRNGYLMIPQVVKIADHYQIEAEKDAYFRHVEGVLVSAVRVLDEAEISPSGLSALAYELVGVGPELPVMSLYQASNKLPIDSFLGVLDKVFQLGHQWWRYNSVASLVEMQDDYDTILPVNLTLKQVSKSSAKVNQAGVVDLYAYQPLPMELQAGDCVRLHGYEIVQREDDEVTLNWPQPRTETLPAYPASSRVRLIDVAFANQYTHDPRQPLLAQVEKTRHDIFCEQAKDVLGVGEERLNEETLQVEDLTAALVNPLCEYQALLYTPRTMDMALVHGDLNFENLLIINQTTPKLIDFGKTRRGHVIHDLLRLETETMLKLVQPALVETQSATTVKDIFDLYTALDKLNQNESQDESHQVVDYPIAALDKSFKILQKIREEAMIYFDQRERKSSFHEEYYPGLVLYLLSAMRFRQPEGDPTPKPKEVAFWGAAVIATLLAHSA